MADVDLKNLYKRPMPSTRTGAIYNAFSYATKIDAEAVAPQTRIAPSTTSGLAATRTSKAVGVCAIVRKRVKAGM